MQNFLCYKSVQPENGEYTKGKFPGKRNKKPDRAVDQNHIKHSTQELSALSPLVRRCVPVQPGSLWNGLLGLSVTGIPEDFQPAARNHRPGETWLQTLPPGKEPCRGSSVSTSQEGSSPSGARAQPQPGGVSTWEPRADPLQLPLGGCMASIHCACPPPSPNFPHSLGKGGISQSTAVKNDWNPAQQG